MKHIADNMIVALDFDGCIASSEQAKIFHTKRLYDIDVTSNQITKDTFPLGLEKYRKLMNYITTGGIMEFELSENVKTVLDRLYSEKFRFVVVTSRHNSNARPELEACIKYCKHYNLPISYYHNTNETSKDYICEKLHARAMIDDTLSKLMALVDTPMSLFYLKQKWNVHKKIGNSNEFGIIPVNGWVQFHAKLYELKTTHEAISQELSLENNWKNLLKIHEYIKNHKFETEKIHSSYLRTLKK